MSRRLLICVGTAVILILVAACGFMLGNWLSEGSQDTENGQSAYISTQQEESGNSADSQKETVQTATGNTASDSDETSVSAETGMNDGNSALDTDGAWDTSGDSSSTDAAGSSSTGSDGLGTAGLDATSTESASGFTQNDGAVSGEYEYIVFPVDGTLVVYYSDAATVYFDSGIEVEHLPDETKSQVEQGIPFQSEEELFGFLESYSS